MSRNDLIIKHLKVILDQHVDSEIVDYINSLKHPEDLTELMENILDKTNTTHMHSYEAIRKILFTNRTSPKTKPEPQTDRSKSQEQHPKGNKQQKGKKKFEDINTFKEKQKKKEGRTMCDCEGQEHELMNNCLNCGRIHCFEEGPGPCFFCKEPVTNMGDEYKVQSSSNKTKKATLKQHKENKVLDDDNDYFKASSQKPNKENTRKLVVALDFATRKVIESSAEDVKIKQKLHDDIKKHLANVDKLYRKLQRQSETSTVVSDNNDLLELLVQMRHKKPVGVEELGPEDTALHFIDYGKAYDEDMVANVDHGLCLSMHQPYASLLIAGVKKHEGRTWKTNHRGRLWIAAAAKIPDEDEVAALETFYRQYYNDQRLKFPRDYPISCLLGCVYVEDCLDEATYRKRFPNGESTSPYVLICSSPIILPIFYPIVGKHKIYPLDKELHNCAKLSIRHAEYGVD